MKLGILAMVAMVLGLAGCTGSTPAPSVGCVIESAVSGTVAIAIAQELQCSNQDAIKASVDAAASKAGICASAPAVAIGKPKAAVDPTAPLKSVGSDICNLVAGNLLTSLASNSIPTAWGCSAANAKDSLKGLIAGACAKTFP